MGDYDERGSGQRSSRPQRHARLKALPCFDDLNTRVLQGHPLPEVAKWLQEEMMVCTDITTDSLVTTLSRFRKDVAPIDIAENLMPKVAFEARRKLSDGISEIDEIVALYEKQMERIALGMNFETTTKILNRHMNQEISLAVDILRRSHDIKMDLGIGGGKNLGTLHVRPELMVEVRQKYGEGVYDALTDPEDRGRVLSIVKSLTQIESDEPTESIDVVGEE